MSQTNRSVDGFIRKHSEWTPVLEALRAVLLDTPLIEDIKWRTPCYTFEEHNVVLMGVMKESCTLSFMKGALLKDPKHILLKPGENTQAARMIRFTDVKSVTTLAATIKTYIDEAIALEKAGAKVAFKSIEEHPIPAELQERLDADPALKKAFHALTPGRQRGYLIHFSGAKQSATRFARIDKCRPMIMAGKGMFN